MINTNLFAFLCSVILSANISYADAVYIKNFSIDRTEVTVGSFAEYSELEGIVTQAEKYGGGYEWAAGWKRTRKSYGKWFTVETNGFLRGVYRVSLCILRALAYLIVIRNLTTTRASDTINYSDVPDLIVHTKIKL